MWTWKSHSELCFEMSPPCFWFAFEGDHVTWHISGETDFENAVTASNLSTISTTTHVTHILLLQHDLLTIRSVSIYPILTSITTMLRRVVASAPRASRALSTTIRPAITSQSRVTATASRTERRCYHEKDKWLPNSIMSYHLQP